ncbi:MULTISPECIES: MFS transporter [Streptomyces]|uniref:MFS transporter n=1 Tax=Streptomyces gilvifuscus TaxID=1550617 RepID=A0ABT5G470_9ACTN|nr:MFS transporter [Streptomyces gilvifuscus]MDC2959634.1 MFS transporter [Streptomyces gilvifuscus]
MTTAGRVRAGHGTARGDEVVEPSPFTERPFLVFAAGNAVNNVGEALYATALPLLAYRLTGSLTVMAWLAAAVPMSMLLAPWFGSVADRRGTSGLVLYGLLAQASAALAMNLLLWQGRPQTWTLFVCALVVAAGGVAYRTGWMTDVPVMFPRCPARARGTLNSLFLATTLAGPVLVAATLPWLGYLGVLWLNLPTFFAPLAVWAVGVRPPRRAAAGAGRREPARLRKVWHDVTADRRIAVTLVLQMVLEAVCGTGLTSLVLFELRHSWRLSGQQAGWVVAAVNLSLLTGNLLVSQRRRLRPRTLLPVALAARAMSLALLAVPVWPLFLTALVLGAVAQGALLAAVVMLRVRYLPQAVMGRASGLMWLLTGSAALLSPVVIPPLDHVAGPHATFLALGAVSSVVMVHLHRARTAWTPTNPATTEPA